jgi:hypothetical protein
VQLNNTVGQKLMRAIFFTLALTLLAGCATPHRSLTEKESALEAFLVAHGFVHDGDGDYSRRYSAVILLKQDFRLSDGSMIPVPCGPADGPDTRVFNYEGFGFLVIAGDGKSLDEPKTSCSVSMSFDQVSADDEKPKGIPPNQALQHNDPSCHESCLRTPRASRGRG